MTCRHRIHHPDCRAIPALGDTCDCRRLWGICAVCRAKPTPLAAACREAHLATVRAA